MRTVLRNAVAALLVAATGIGAEAAPKIGVAAAVKNDVQGRLGGTIRPLATGSDVFSNERIRTGDASTAQILFRDKTTLTMGPRAELTLDRFVYNPSRGTGEVVLNAVQGAFRFVSGSQDPRNYTIKTPVGTIGIRGTIVEIRVPDSVAPLNQFTVQKGYVIVLLVKGALNLTVDGKTHTLDKPGDFFVVSDGAVKGPATWPSTIVNVDGTPPLYGWSFQDQLPQEGLPDGGLAGIDQLNAIIQGSKRPLPDLQ